MTASRELYLIRDVVLRLCEDLGIEIFQLSCGDHLYTEGADLSLAMAGHFDDNPRLGDLWYDVKDAPEFREIRLGSVMLGDRKWRAAARAWKAGRL